MKEIQDIVVSKKDTVIGSSNTKTLYIVVMEDPSAKTKKAQYFATRRDIGASTVEISGYQITDSKLTQILDSSQVNDAILIASKGSEVENLTIPWGRIIRIKNILLNVK